MESQPRLQPLAVVVLAAGLGKRMASNRPKVLHRLAGLPLAAHVLRAIAPLNPTRTVLVTGHGSEDVRATLGTRYGRDSLLPVEYILQPEQLGTGHAVHMAREALEGYGGPVLVLYGDTPLLRTTTLSALLARHRQLHPRLTMLTCIASDPTGYGRVVRDANQRVVEVVEEKNATLVQKAISEVNSGVYVFESDWLWPHLERVEMNPVGEYYLTDLVGMAIREDRAPVPPSTPARGGGNPPAASGRSNVVTFTQDGLDEAMGINSRAQLAEAEEIIQRRLRDALMAAGVTMLLPHTVYLGMDVSAGPDTVLYPGTVLEGRTTIGAGCVIGPNSHIIDSSIGDGCHIVSSVIEASTVERGVHIGPFSHVRPGTHLEEGVHLGNFVEVKNSRLARGVHSGHVSYLGDAEIGENTNIGAGTITANFDRATRSKHKTTIGKNVFVGVDTMIVAPRQIGDGAATGAGAIVTKDVAPDTLVVGVPARPIRKLAQTTTGDQRPATGDDEATTDDQKPETGDGQTDA